MNSPTPTQTLCSSPVTDDSHTWDLESIFSDEAAWRREVEAVRSEAHRLSSLRGTLGASAESLCKALSAIDALRERFDKTKVYASMRLSANMRDDVAAGMKQQVDALGAVVAASLSFVEPEVLSLGWTRVEEMLRQHLPLERFRFFLSEIERNRPHVLPPEQETLLQQLSVLQRLPDMVRDAAHDGDMRFAPIEVDGQRVEVEHGTVDRLLQHADRKVREAAYCSYTDAYLANTKTLTATLTANATTSLIFNQARGFSSSLEAALFAHSLPAKVYEVAMESCRHHQHLFQRYFRAKAKMLKLAKLAEYDIFAKLSPNSPDIAYHDGVEMVLESLAPLGDEYVSIARRGLTTERWAHVYPAPGKFSNAFSSGAYGTKPFLLLNYTPTMPEVGTLAHELGHSMHSYLTNRIQPRCYARCSMTVAETASNLNQVLLRAHLLKTADREMACAVLDEAFFFAHRYLFMMPILSQVEHLLHDTYAQGETLGATAIGEATVKAFAEGYGDSVEFDPERLGVKWGQFCHFYVPYYLFQYSIGISAAMSIGRRLVEGDVGARESYLRFLSVGGSLPPQETFSIIGVDITSPDTYRDAFHVVQEYVTRLESLAG